MRTLTKECNIVSSKLCETFSWLSTVNECLITITTANLFGECMFCITLSFWHLRFCFWINIRKLDDSFTFIWKKILCHIFLSVYHILSLGSSDMNWEFIRREYSFSINSKISFMSSGNKQLLSLKVSVTIFCRVWYFGNFDIKTVHLDQNSFEWK